MKDEELKKAAEAYAGENNGVEFGVPYTAFIKGAQWYEAHGWISVEDAPLFIKNENGHWECTENGDNEFIAAVPYTDSAKPGQDLWWIRHCVVEDGEGLHVVCDDYTEKSGWELEDVTHYRPLPSPPINKPKQ
jgi:hypothetical protein